VYCIIVAVHYCIVGLYSPYCALVICCDLLHSYLLLWIVPSYYWDLDCGLASYCGCVWLAIPWFLVAFPTLPWLLYCVLYYCWITDCPVGQLTALTGFTVYGLLYCTSWILLYCCIDLTVDLPSCLTLQLIVQLPYLAQFSYLQPTALDLWPCVVIPCTDLLYWPLIYWIVVITLLLLVTCGYCVPLCMPYLYCCLLCIVALWLALLRWIYGLLIMPASSLLVAIEPYCLPCCGLYNCLVWLYIAHSIWFWHLLFIVLCCVDSVIYYCCYPLLLWPYTQLLLLWIIVIHCYPIWPCYSYCMVVFTLLFPIYLHFTVCYYWPCPG